MFHGRVRMQGTATTA